MSFLLFLVLLPLILSLDSQYVANYFPYGQWLANVATLPYFLLIYRLSSPRLRRLMLIGLVVSTIGEISFALIIKMYEYRLHSIPLYVPLGHTILYAQVYNFVRLKPVLRYPTQFKLGMLVLSVGFAFGWLIFNRDLYGFICFGVFGLILLKNRPSRLFFLAMYLMVAYLELLGTTFGNWYWPPYLLNRWPLISSANPPSSISIFYMAFDITCLAVYLLFNRRLRHRFGASRAFRKKQSQPYSEKILETVK